MSYARWKKCDFQIHTPRDPSWSKDNAKKEMLLGLGDTIPETGEAATEEDVDRVRHAWARKFVEACYKKNLEAIAITDHHDMVMIPYVQRAIKDFKNENSDYDLWFFPGMELTTKGKKQCLILFDHDFDLKLCVAIQHNLGIVKDEKDEWRSKAKKPEQLKYSYPDLVEEIDSFGEIRGRYIILPNVSEGEHSVITGSDYQDFIRMPYIGGYLDRGKTLDTLGPKFRKILKGEDKNWSRKEIYPLPTSDNRCCLFKDLGENNTWIKLAAPTAEAIRQAFLSHKSHIRVGQQPKLPALYVSRMKVEGTSVLDDFEIVFSPEFNVIIGGRGAGKSTLLEYLAFGLGISCSDGEKDKYSNQERMKKLVEDTFKKCDAKAHLDIIHDGARFSVSRASSNSYKHDLHGNGKSVGQLTIEQVRNLFRSVSFCQGELSDLPSETPAKALKYLLQFAENERSKDLSNLEREIEGLKNRIKKQVHNLNASIKQQASIQICESAIRALEARRDALKDRLLELTPEESTLLRQFKEQELYQVQKGRLFDSTNLMRESLSNLIKAAQNKAEWAGEKSSDAEEMVGLYDDLFNDMLSEASALLSKYEDHFEKISSVKNRLDNSFAELKRKRDEVLNRSNSNSELRDQIGRLDKELEAERKNESKLKLDYVSIDEVVGKLLRQVELLEQKMDDLHEFYRSFIEHLNDLPKKAMQIDMKSNGDLDDLRNTIDQVTKGTRIRDHSKDDYIKRFEGDDALRNLMEIKKDYVEAFLAKGNGSEHVNFKSSLQDLANKSESASKIFIDNIAEVSVAALLCSVLYPSVTFYYCDGDRKIPFEQASEGQRAAALLFMLLEQEGGPILIDQPEGDLDNKIISELADVLHTAKSKRQIIFVSHNANIVVNGSPELVCCVESSTGGKRCLAEKGTIDDKNIRNIITATIEGGEKAFKDRLSKYGY